MSRLADGTGGGYVALWTNCRARTMDICHPHNRRAGLRRGSGPFGLRLSLPAGDTMRSLLGDDWHVFEWFETEADRERRMTELKEQFVYYRKGDRSTYVVERVNREPAADTG